MGRTRYCSTCGTLLSDGAVICGECGARYQASPYERRATDAPGAWSQAPAQRSRDLGREDGAAPQDEGVELITRDALAPKSPSATTLRSREQYDQVMVTQPPMQHNGPGYASGAPSGPGSPVAAPRASSTGPEMAPPLDGCSPASPLKRLLAALIDAVLSTLMVVPLIVGVSLMIASGTAGTLSLVLIGVGVALPLAYALLMIWLVGAKGFTLGKLSLGLRLTRTTAGGPLGFLRSAGRWVLYGLVPPVMALSIFLDPKRHLRGFHDRAVDSTVVDIRTGRNPMKPRPDDFERAGAEHYLGAPSVAVSTHENLLAEPGAAWKDSAQSAPAQPETAGWGDAQQQGAPSPYAPHLSGGSAPSAADAPMTSAPWSSPPAPEPAASQQPADGGWAPPPIDPIPPPQPSWGQPPSAPAASPSGDAQGWAPHMPQPEQAVPAPHGPGTEYPPSDLTGDAWDVEDHGVDEQTRLTVADDPLGDLEQTRISAVQLPPVAQLRLTTDDGGERIVEKAVVIGRNPAAPGDEVLFVMKDDTRSVSKTHLRIDGTGEDVTVTDLGSTNGSSILRADGSRENLVPDSPTVLPPGAQVTLGDRTVTVERMQ
ncbi:RDD family protein [Brachybacterium vulturis]|uniref:RDD family protein n=1 Tax=Brachybacterium vulturis TaxID=2017484 RepID=UPI003736F738